MTRPPVVYTTKELSKNTLPDFEQLFESHPAPGAYPCWCMYNHQRCASDEIGVLGHVARRQCKRQLVGRALSHGILVYANRTPVGWCQYGRKDELPRIDNDPRYRKVLPDSPRRLWRITCFVVDRKHRKRGVAAIALKAALDSMRRKGGGLVEAYPIVRWGAYTQYRGVRSMFRKHGFEVVAPLGRSNVVMQKIVYGRNHRPTFRP